MALAPSDVKQERLPCSDAFAQIILKCTQFEESERYANFEEIVGALNESSNLSLPSATVRSGSRYAIYVVDAGDAWESTK